MWCREHLVFSGTRFTLAVLVVLFAHVFPTFAQVTGFDTFLQPIAPGQVISAGSTFTIKWTPSSPIGQISIYLLEGVSKTTLQIGPVIADSQAGSYDWTVPTNLLAYSFFAFKLALDSDPTQFQYSTYFSISNPTTSSQVSPTPSTSSTLPSQSPSLATAAPTSSTAPSSLVASTPSSSSILSSFVTSVISSSPVPSSSAILASSSSTILSSLGTLASSSSLTVSSLITSTSTSSPDTDNNSGLTPSAKAGIGIGAAFGGIVLFTSIAFAFFHYGKRAAARNPLPTDSSTWGKAELGAERLPPAELGAAVNNKGFEETGVAELAGKGGEVAELEAREEGRPINR